MNEFEQIEESIKKIPRGKIFFPEYFYKKYPPENIKKVLARLARNGEIKFIARGMYVRPKKSHYLKGRVLMPNSYEIVKAISKKTGEVISMYGPAAANYVGLSTQIQMRAIYYTTGRSRYVIVNGKKDIKLVHINPKKLVMPGTIVCLVVTALWYQGKNLLTPLAVKKIHHRLDSEEYCEVIKNLDKMPLWMKCVFEQYQDMQPDDPQLREDSNSYYQG